MQNEFNASKSQLVNQVCHDIRAAGVDVILELPCDRISPLLCILSKTLPYIPLTREEEGVGIAAGISLAGAKPLMIVQSSGLGNMINAIMSLTKFYKLPLPIIISQRGIYKENIAAQIPMGSSITRILDAMEVEYSTYYEESDLAKLKDDISSIYSENKVKCLLFSPKICEGEPKAPILPSKPIGNISMGKPVPLKVTKNEFVAEDLGALLTRFEILDGLKTFLNGKAVVCNMGFPSRELYNILDQDSNFYMLGSLGLVSSIGLGVALFSDKEVIIIDGDGSLLMNPNSLFLIGTYQPKNLCLICIDNGAYGSTGNQPTITSNGFKLEELASASRFPKILVSSNPASVLSFPGPGPGFIKLTGKAGNAKVGTIKLTEEEIKNRFSKWLSK